jgi:serine/threonine-protein kinase
MGVVYRARDTVLNRVVAFKILSDKLKSSTTAVEYFLREARASAALSHPNIVTLFDAGEQNGQYYMAMELVEGETLKSILQRRGHFPEKLLRYVTIHACRGLAYAHDKGLIHRDIKSGNLMLTKDRQIKIMDFGLAKFVEEVQKENTRAVGTPYYMSPEQIRGRELDPRSDIYSLGITLFECATGMVPFAKGDLSYHHVHTPPTQPRQYNAKLSRRMNAVIMRCIQKDPADRFQSAKEILKAVKAKR